MHSDEIIASPKKPMEKTCWLKFYLKNANTYRNQVYKNKNWSYFCTVHQILPNKLIIKTKLTIRISGFSPFSIGNAGFEFKNWSFLILIHSLKWYSHSNNTRIWRPSKIIMPAGLLRGNIVVGLEIIYFCSKLWPTTNSFFFISQFFLIDMHQLHRICTI